MEIGWLVGIGVLHDLTFLDFWSEASEPVGSEQREHCSVIPLSYWLFLPYNAISHILVALKNISKTKLSNQSQLCKGGNTSSEFLLRKLCFNATDDHENRMVGRYRNSARFDVFGFLIRGFWARWQRATRALFNHFPEVIAIFCHQMLFPIFWMPFEKCWGILHFQYCRGILQVHSFS